MNKRIGEHIKIFTIEKINFTGKWCEFWFEELKEVRKNGKYDQCCKIYMMDMVDFINIGKVATDGYKGKFVVWGDACDRPTVIFDGEKPEEL